MLKHTMGAGGAFEYRRAELAILHKGVPVTDDMIANSFFEKYDHFLISISFRGQLLISIDSSAKEDGAVTQYLLNAQVAVVIGNSLFVHGIYRDEFPCSSVHH